MLQYKAQVCYNKVSFFQQVIHDHLTVANFSNYQISWDPGKEM